MIGPVLCYQWAGMKICKKARKDIGHNNCKKGINELCKKGRKKCSKYSRKYVNKVKRNKAGNYARKHVKH